MAVAKKKPDHRVGVTPVKNPPRDYLNGENRNAYDALVAEFTRYGLQSLAPEILKMLQEGYGEDTIALRLQDTKAYKARFAANDARLAKGFKVLSPAEYLAAEESYRQVMRSSGLPTGFYDSNNDYTNWLANDVSPTEVNSRVAAAKEYYYQFPSARQKAQEWYSYGGNEGDLIAMALDPAKALPVVESRLKALEVGASVTGINRDLAERVGATGLGADAIRQGAGVINQTYNNLSKLAAYSGVDYSVDALASDVFLNDANSALTRDRLTRNETARFAGSGGQTKTTLGTSGAGQL